MGQTALECLEVDELRRQVLATLEQVFGFELAHFWLAGGPDKVSLETVFAHYRDEKLIEQLNRYYHKVDPYFLGPFEGRHFPRTNLTTNWHRLWPAGYFESTEFFHDFCRPYQIFKDLNFYLVSRTGPVGVICLNRSRASPSYTEKEAQKAGLMAPFIAAALDKAMNAQKFAAVDFFVEELASAGSDAGLIIADSSFKALYYTRQATEIFSGLDQAETRPSWSVPLPKVLQEQCLSLKRAGNSKKSNKTLQTIIALPEGGFRREIGLDLRLIDHPQAGSLFVINIQSDRPKIISHDLFEEQGLTSRERELVHLISLGLKNREISEKLCISLLTVQNHLHNIYTKMGVRSRTGLLSRLLYAAS
ncbi:MAG: helix-turn-helix transcriptional regulator [Deltaproteobacteria bacterium]|nr:helix-turn-helix transcriptional regulator [Deltaproteobacteria bacterium]